MFLRLPPEVYAKLRRMADAHPRDEMRGTMQGMVIDLIEQAPEKRV